MAIHKHPAFTVIVTRPVGQARSLLHSLRQRGVVAVSLPALSLQTVIDDRAARRALQWALKQDVIIFSSPAAVRFASQLRALRPASGCRVIALGDATARALRRSGMAAVAVPERADSEGVLALPELASPRGRIIGLVGAHGGRNLLLPVLRARGACVHDVHVYQRVPARLSARHFAAVLKARQPLLTTATSAQTLALLASRLPPEAWRSMLEGVALVSSRRLERISAKTGFRSRLRARSATNTDLIAAIEQFSVR